MIPELDPATGALPCGRFPAELDEVAAAFVNGLAPKRAELWTEWQDFTAILRRHVHVASVWLGGSFFTAKPDPSDVDSVFWVENTELLAARADLTRARVINFLTTPGWAKANGLRVDAYVVPWVSNGGVEPRNEEDRIYYRDRGYWDDLWVRLRSGAKGATPTRLDSIPRRGYLEVTLDGHE